MSNQLFSQLKSMWTGRCSIKTSELESKLTQLKGRSQSVMFVFADNNFLTIASNEVVHFHHSKDRASHDQILAFCHVHKFEQKLKGDTLAISIQRDGNEHLLKKLIKLLLSVEEGDAIGYKISKLATSHPLIRNRSTKG